MKRKRFSELNIESIKKVIENSSTISECLRKIDYVICSSNFAGLKQICKINAIDISHLGKHNNLSPVNTSRFSMEEILVENSMYNRAELKRRLLREELIKYQCAKCELTDIWNGEKLVLQLDHINGISNDNRLVNLQLLCPNCHSQTKTYAGKNARKYDKPIRSKIPRKKKFEIGKGQLVELITKLPMVKIGKMFGVSDSAIRRRARLLEIDYKSLSKFAKNRNEFS